MQSEGAAKLLGRPTPLLRVGPSRPEGRLEQQAFCKLESLRPSGGADDRVLGILPDLPRGTNAAIAATGGAALAAAAWARGSGVELQIVLHGAVTHEVRATLAIWGARAEFAGSREEALEHAARLPGELLPPLDGDEAAKEASGTLGAELLGDVEEAGIGPALLVAPAGARAALLGALFALRGRFPSLEAVALVAGDEELPELPRAARFPREGIAIVPVRRAEAAQARHDLARSTGLLASHAAAAAARIAATRASRLGRPAIALITAAGEREFSLVEAISTPTETPTPTPTPTRT